MFSYETVLQLCCKYYHFDFASYFIIPSQTANARMGEVLYNQNFTGRASKSIFCLLPCLQGLHKVISADEKFTQFYELIIRKSRFC